MMGFFDADVRVDDRDEMELWIFFDCLSVVFGSTE